MDTTLLVGVLSLAENININLLKAKSKDFYWLIIHRRYNDQHSGLRRWNRTITEDKTNWKKIFTSVRKVCKENKLREFHFKFIHRVVVTKKGCSDLTSNQIIIAFIAGNETP